MTQVIRLGTTVGGYRARTCAILRLLGLLALAACGPAPATEPIRQPSAVPTVTETAALVDATQIAANSIASCPYADRNDTTQVGFQNIYPGETTGGELVALIGEPHNHREIARWPNRIWDYPAPLGASVSVQRNVVARIDHRRGDDTQSTVNDILEELGCPDLILIHDISPHATGDGFTAELAYSQRGVSYYTESYPTFLTDAIFWDIYYVPASPVAYLKSQYGRTLPHDVDIVAWEDAFIDNGQPID